MIFASSRRAAVTYNMDADSRPGSYSMYGGTVASRRNSLASSLCNSTTSLSELYNSPELPHVSDLKHMSKPQLAIFASGSSRLPSLGKCNASLPRFKGNNTFIQECGVLSQMGFFHQSHLILSEARLHRSFVASRTLGHVWNPRQNCQFSAQLSKDRTVSRSHSRERSEPSVVLKSDTEHAMFEPDARG